MKTNARDPDYIENLRRRAEAIIAAGPRAMSSVPSADLQRLVNELHIHQVELEMQNDELLKTQIYLDESRRMYSDLYDFAPVGYFSIDNNNKISQVNLPGARMLGMDREILLGKHFKFYGPDDGDTFHLHINKVRKNGNTETCELKLEKKDGSIFDARLESVATRKNEKGVSEILTTVSDITELINIEKERLILEKEVRHVQRLESLGVLAGGIAHDFNNILTSVLGNTGLMLMELPDDSPLREKLVDIETASKRAVILAQQMLAYSGKGKFDVRTINLNEVIMDISKLLESSISRQVTMEFKLDKNIPAIEADVAQIQQVVMNLITNAAEAIGDGNGVVTVVSGITMAPESDGQGLMPTEPPSGEYVYIKVVDSGIGMNEETLERLFDPFFSTKFSGRGLGMSAVLGIVHGHNGCISVDSKPGDGTTFTVSFPATNKEAQIEAARDLDQPHKWRGTGTILLIDDEKPVLKIVTKMLEKYGFTVITVDDGERAQAIFRENIDKIVCVIVDFTMPHMNGIECMRRLREIRDDVPIVMASGYSVEDIASRFKGDTPDAFVAKPLHMHDLVNILKGLIGGELR